MANTREQQALEMAFQASRAPRPIDLSGWTEAQLNKIVSIDMSNEAGNCEGGSVNWMSVHFPGRNAVTIREALTEAYKTKDRIPLVVRACKHAASL